MSALERIALGAPGVYPVAPEPVRRLQAEPMDACAFVGVAPRGPCRVPRVDGARVLGDDWRQCDPVRPRLRSVAVPVGSFDEYRRLFGGFEGPGLLPYAVAAYFEQGGRLAYVVRIVHHYGTAADGQGVASGLLAGVAGEVRLHARSEGAWGNRLTATLGFRARPLRASAHAPDALRLDDRTDLPAGSLLRLRLADASRVLRFVERVDWLGDPAGPRRVRVARLDAPFAGALAGVEIVDGALAVADGAGEGERFDALGLHVAHPNWAGTVLCRASRLVWPDIAWAGDRIRPASADLAPAGAPPAPFAGGVDRYADVATDDFFDADWDPLAEEPASGVQALARVPVTQFAVPDLYHPGALPPVMAVGAPSLAGARFADCVTPVTEPLAAAAVVLPGLLLDPRDRADRERIVALQQRLVAFAATTREHIALLDVPPGLQGGQVLDWRSRFDSAYAAAYHPWLGVARADDARAATVALPPSAVAAGIVAARELAFGIAHGPANVVAREVVRLLERVDRAGHDRLHGQGINVFLDQPDGIRLTGARTLARDARWRQLSVRRLMLMLRRSLARRLQWVVFEPNTPALRRELTRMLTAFLRRLHQQGAFAGATEAEAFFVRCDDALNPPQRVDRGELCAEIGVAPAEPIEFIVLTVARTGDGTLILED